MERIQFLYEGHAFEFSRNVRYEALLKLLQEALQIRPIQIQYFDEEPEKITVENQVEYEEALRYTSSFFIEKKLSQLNTLDNLPLLESYVTDKRDPQESIILARIGSDTPEISMLENSTVKPTTAEIAVQVNLETPIERLQDIIKQEISAAVVGLQMHSPPKPFPSTQCTICSTTPISEILYICETCKEIQLCQQCENDFEHPHALLKYRDPETWENSLFVYFRDMGFSPGHIRRALSGANNDPQLAANILLHF